MLGREERQNAWLMLVSQYPLVDVQSSWRALLDCPPSLYFKNISEMLPSAFLFGSRGMAALQKLASTLIVIDYFAI